VDSRLEFAYSTQIRSLDMQASSVDSFRNRAGTLFAVNALVATLLGGEVLKISGLHGWAAWTAIGSLIAACVFTVGVLWPFHWLQSRISGEWLIREWIAREGLAIDDIHSALTRIADQKYQENLKKIRTLEWIYEVAATLIIVQIACWLVALR